MKEQYLGNGIYAKLDNGVVTLGRDHEIVLDEMVFKRLVEFVKPERILSVDQEGEAVDIMRILGRCECFCKDIEGKCSVCRARAIC